MKFVINILFLVSRAIFEDFKVKIITLDEDFRVTIEGFSEVFFINFKRCVIIV